MKENEAIKEFLINISQSDLKGHGVYDIFNSPFLKFFEKFKIKVLNVAITQLFKRCPLNLHSLFRIGKTINPKSLGLLLKGAIINKDKGFQEKLIEKIISLRNAEFKNCCWGYNFDVWTMRGGLFPKDYPNAIVTYFIGEALLDYYEKVSPDEEIKEMLLSINRFFLEDIKRSYTDYGLCFSYSPIDSQQIYNASALISKYLHRCGNLFSLSENKEHVRKAIDFLLAVQNKDGSWYYGSKESQKWIDSFHTEYILEFFDSVLDILSDDEFMKYQRAKKFYFDRFVVDKVLCNYYPDSTFPINIHSVASRIIYNVCNKRNRQAGRLVDWVFANMYNKNKQGFYYEKHKLYTNKNIYFRWNNAWMYLALSLYINGKY